MFPTSILQGTYNQSAGNGGNGGGSSGPYSSGSITYTATFGGVTNEQYKGMAINGSEIYLFNSKTGNPYPRYSNNSGATFSQSSSWPTIQVYNSECFYDTNINEWVAISSSSSSTYSTLQTNSDPQNNSWTSVSATSITSYSRTVKFINGNYYGMSPVSGIVRGTSLTNAWSQRATTSNPVISNFLQIGEAGGTYIASLKDFQIVSRSTDGVVFSNIYAPSLSTKLIAPTGDGSGNWVSGNTSSNRTVYVSTDDGLNWINKTFAYSGYVNTENIEFIVYLNGLWVAGTSQGSIISSTDPFTGVISSWDLIYSNSNSTVDALQIMGNDKIAFTGTNGIRAFFKIITLS